MFYCVNERLNRNKGNDHLHKPDTWRASGRVHGARDLEIMSRYKIIPLIGDLRLVLCAEDLCAEDKTCRDGRRKKENLSRDGWKSFDGAGGWAINEMYREYAAKMGKVVKCPKKNRHTETQDPDKNIK